MTTADTEFTNAFPVHRTDVDSFGTPATDTAGTTNPYQGTTAEATFIDEVPHDSVDLFATSPGGRNTAILPTAILQQLLDTAGDAAATSSHIPALMTIRLTAGDGMLKAQATDLSWGVEAIVPATVVGSFDVCLAAKRLRALAGSLVPATSTKLDLKGTEMVVTCDRSVSRFKTISPEEFPAFPMASTNVLSCTGERIGLAGRLVPWAASTIVGDRLNACKLTVNLDGTRLEASDRYAAIVWEGLCDGLDDSDELGVTGETSLLLPPKVLADLGKITGRAPKERVFLAVTGEPSNPGHLVVAYEQGEMRVTIAARCLEGAAQYPPLARLLDHHRDQGAQQPTLARVVVQANVLEASLRRVLHFSDDNTNATTGGIVRWTITDGTLLIECHTREDEESKDEIAVITEGPGVAEGQAARVRYGSDLLRNTLRAVGSDASLTITIPAPLSPTQFTSDLHPGLRGLVMALEAKGDAKPAETAPETTQEAE